MSGPLFRQDQAAESAPAPFANRSDRACTDSSAAARADRDRGAADAFRSDMVASGPRPRIGEGVTRPAGLGALEACSAATAPGRDAGSGSPATRADAAHQPGAPRSLPLGDRSDPVTAGCPYSYNTYSARPPCLAQRYPRCLGPNFCSAPSRHACLKAQTSITALQATAEQIWRKGDRGPIASDETRAMRWCRRSRMSSTVRC
jgi:hypothetical protein